MSKHLLDRSFGTKAVRGGSSPKEWPQHETSIPPIVLATGFNKRFQDQDRECSNQNPTREALERSLAALEGGKYALTFSSGLGTNTCLAHLLKSGDNIVCGDDVYGGTNRYFRTCSSRFGISLTLVDMMNIEELKRVLQEKPNTKLVWMETPTNPTMKICDIAAIASAVKSYSDALLVVDNTFMSPYFQKPLKWGADVVVHSVTKYINGHSDVLMGAIILNDRHTFERLRNIRSTFGAISSPFDCYLANRGIKTLHLRMEYHMKSGLEVAKYLESHPMVKRVLHPGLKSHPQHELALKQGAGFSGMVAFYINGGSHQAKAFANNLKLFSIAVSLGAVESLVEIPCLMSHASVPAEHLASLNIDESLVRLSIGIETPKDLIADIRQALEVARETLIINYKSKSTKSLDPM